MKRNKLLAVFLALAMTLSLLPTAALADDLSVGTDEELKFAIQNANSGDTITLGADITITEPIEITDKTLTLNMNGCTITYGAVENSAAIIDIEGTSDITISGSGAFDYNDEYLNSKNSLGYILRLYDSSKLTIENGTFHAGLTCVQAGGSASVVIENGTFSGEYSYQNTYWVLNLIDNSAASISVKGGTFKNYNPAESHTENPIANFCATGYVSVDNGDDTFTVKPLSEVAEAKTSTQYYLTLGEAITNAGANDTVTLLKDVTLEKGIKVEKDITLDLNGKTLKRDNGQALWVAEGNVSVIGTGTISSDNTINGGYAALV